MLSQTNVHWLAINKLDLVTAHNRCLRIISHRHFDPLVTQHFLHCFDVRVGHAEVGAETMTQIVEVEVPDAGPSAKTPYIR
jgi:hypothetical protein